MAARAVDREFVHIIGLAMASNLSREGPPSAPRAPQKPPELPQGPFWSRLGPGTEIHEFSGGSEGRF